MTGPLRVTRERWLGADVLSYPDRIPTVVDALDRATRKFNDRIAFVDGDDATTYGTFAELVEGATATLREMGVRPGDRVAVAARNGLPLAVALFACARGGFTMVGLSARLRVPQWTYMLRHSRARVALGGHEPLPALQAAAEQAGLCRVEGLDGLLGRRRPWSYTAEQRPDEAATYAVVYTSGTTGRPKASQVVHRCSMHSAHSYERLLNLRPDDRTAVWFPLTYISAIHAHVLPMMLVGGRSVLVPDASPATYLRFLREHRITWAYTVPSLWLLLLRRPAFATPRFDHIRLAAFGGSPFPRPAVDDLRAVLRRARLHDIYGLSETHSPATMLLDEEFASKGGSVGRPLPCMEAKVVHDHGQILDCGAGELLLRGSLVTSGYLDDPQATTAAIHDGWLRTGDIGRIDPDGYVWILDRKKDVIDRGGHNIYSAEVERILLSHPDVVDAAAVGVPDATGTEAVACVVVPRAGRVPRRGELRRWVSDNLADYAAPRIVEYVDALPRNPSGKVRKDRLRATLGR